MHFNLLRSSYPTVPLYADGCELLASGAFLTSVSVSKNHKNTLVSGIIKEMGVL